MQVVSRSEDFRICEPGKEIEPSSLARAILVGDSGRAIDRKEVQGLECASLPTTNIPQALTAADSRTSWHRIGLESFASVTCCLPFKREEETGLDCVNVKSTGPEAAGTTILQKVSIRVQGYSFMSSPSVKFNIKKNSLCTNQVNKPRHDIPGPSPSFNNPLGPNLYINITRPLSCLALRKTG